MRKPRLLTLTFLQFVAALGVVLTEAQAVLYSVLFDLVPVPDSDLGRALFGFVGEVEHLARKTKVMVKGARIGGTYFGALAAVWYAFRVDAEKLARGEPLYCACVGPDMRIASQWMTFVRGVLRSSPAFTIKSESATLIVAVRPDGVEVHFVALPATSGGSSLRGRWYAFVHFTEFSFFRDANFVVNDVDCYRAVKPRTKGAILIESTPWIESGLLYELDRDNFGDPQTATVAHCPTRTMRTDDPAILADVESEFVRDSESAANEYDCQYLLAGSSVFFDELTIKSCVDETLPAESMPEPDERVFAGGDVGLVTDSSAKAVVSVDVDEIVTLRKLVELKPKKGEPLKLSHVIATWAASLKPYRLTTVTVDQASREPAREWADLHKITLDNAPAGIDGVFEVFENLRRCMREGRLVFARNARLIQQLRLVTSVPSSGGKFSIKMPRRRGLGHGDLVAALTLAVYAATEGSSQIAGGSVVVGYPDHGMRPEMLRDGLVNGGYDENGNDPRSSANTRSLVVVGDNGGGFRAVSGDGGLRTVRGLR